MGETFDRMTGFSRVRDAGRRVEMSDMLTATLISLGVMFVAELGDKSQLITMTYALRHRWWVVLSGVAIAALLVHGMSVLIGHYLGLTLPQRPEHQFVLLVVVSSYVLAELGDKTMLATVALASDHNWADVWIGATFAMVLADGLAIAVGALLHRRLPERLLHGLASVLFVLFGLWLLFDAALGWRWAAVVATVSVGAVAGVAAVIVPTRTRIAARGLWSRLAGECCSK